MVFQESACLSISICVRFSTMFSSGSNLLKQILSFQWYSKVACGRILNFDVTHQILSHTSTCHKRL